MRYITLNEAKEIHSRLTERTGGDSGLRDEGLLISALRQCEQTFDGQELYPTLEEKASVLAHSLISNHAFVDGNKRIGMLLMLTTLALNGCKLRLSDEAIASVGFAIARGEFSQRMLVKWIIDNKE